MTKLPWLFLCGVLATGCGGDDQADFDAGPDGPSDGGVDAPGFYRTIPAEINRDLDVLVVVDNSGSMLTEQQQLAASFPSFVDTLSRVAGGLPNRHLGVLSSKVGGAGAPGVPGCPGAGDDGNLLTGPPGNTCATQFGLQDTFISDVASADGARARNYTGDLAPLFTCMASLGTNGCGFEMHLESMFRSLQPGKNPGFYRRDAHLAVIILADEDDCSTEVGTMFGDPTAGLASELGPRTSFRCFEFGVRCAGDVNPRSFGVKTGCAPDPSSPYMFEVARYVDFLRSLKSGAAEVVVAGIVGTFDAVSGEVAVGASPVSGSDPTFPTVQRSCIARDPNDSDDGAAPAVRLQAFLSAFPGRNAITSVCNTNLSDALVEIGQQVKNAIGNSCFDVQLADTSPDPGVQPSCTVTDVVDPRGPNRAEAVVPACAQLVQTGATCEAGNVAAPCWCLVQDPVSCPASGGNLGGYALGINRGGTTPAPGQVVELFCRTE